MEILDRAGYEVPVALSHAFDSQEECPLHEKVPERWISDNEL
jgi:hypothetical protein